ncbi:hypothetical protein ScPMuIL_017248 [Solemya velum]
MYENQALVIVCLLAFISLGTALECYVCQNQPNNRDKCVKTTIQCKEEQDTCRTHIKWGQPDYWTPRTERMYYIDKACDIEERCERDKHNLGLQCVRDWYNDWKCIECCQGDRCNYYVTMGSSSHQLSILVLTTVVLGQLYRWLLA